jgi:sec-independent protein translocase protein TatC
MAASTSRQRSQQEAEEMRMTILEHLEELRVRLVRIFIYLALGTTVAFFFGNYIFAFLYQPAGGASFKPIAIEMTESFFTYFKVCLMTGVGISMPLLVWELIGYIAPGLTKEEKRYALLLMPGILVCFVAGVSFGYFVTLPFAIKYLLGFNIDVVNITPTLSNYIGFVTTILFWMGLVFELPVILYFLSKIGIVNHKQLAGFRKYFVVIAFVVAAVVTPTPDPLNQILFAAPLMILWEVGVQLSRLA